ncbi:MAG: NAD(P)H-dependent flavin oxidoreductase [Gemmatimonadaceae bacterium]
MHDLRKLLGIELPIVQAPMAGVQGSALAIAVSNAGGLGSLPCALLSPEQMQQELEAIRAATAKPFNVNFFCHREAQASDAQLAAWRQALAPYYAALGTDMDAIPSGPGRSSFDSAQADVLEKLKPPVVSFHFGLPADDLLQRARSWHPKIISSATTVDEALWLEARGVDVIIAQGIEAGGHRGMFLTDDVSTQIGTFALLPQIVRAVKIPVIAAGGIADASGIHAATALGAAGVQLGTAFLLCPECSTSPVHRAALKSVDARHTALTNVFTGRPARGIVNRIIRELGPMSALAPPFPLATGAVWPLRARAEANGSGDFSPLWSGQNVSGCREVPAAQLLRDLAVSVEAIFDV